MSKDGSHSSHVLLTLGVLFTLGGATRFLPGPEAAAESPRSPTSAAAPVQETTEPRAGEAASAAPTAPKGGKLQVCFSGDQAASLQEDRWLFESEQETLNEEKIALKALQADLQQQSADLAAEKATLNARWEKMQAEAGADIDHLSRMYGAMKPDQAATIFNQMDAAFAAGFLRRLSSDQAGLILASMQAEKAYVVSLKLASRNQDVRDAEAPP